MPSWRSDDPQYGQNSKTGDNVRFGHHLSGTRIIHFADRSIGVGPDSAIHGMSVVGGLHLACWGVYNPAGPGMVKRAINARFLSHRTSDVAGPNLRAYSIEVDPLRPNREVVTSITGVYTSSDNGEDWRRLNDLPRRRVSLGSFQLRRSNPRLRNAGYVSGQSILQGLPTPS